MIDELQSSVECRSEELEHNETFSNYLNFCLMNKCWNEGKSFQMHSSIENDFVKINFIFYCIKCWKAAAVTSNRELFFSLHFRNHHFILWCLFNLIELFLELTQHLSKMFNSAQKMMKIASFQTVSNKFSIIINWIVDKQRKRERKRLINANIASMMRIEKLLN